MIIRQLRKNENYKSVMISSTAFNFSTDIEKAKNEELNEEVIGAFKDDDETLMAQIAIKNYQSMFNGKPVGALGIAGVATFPEYRRSGCIRKIFNEIFKMKDERGWDTSFLYPFSFRYYRKFGYESIIKHKIINVTFDSLTHIPSNTSAVLYRGEEKVLDDILKVYNAFALRHNVIFKRIDSSYISKNPNSSREYNYVWYDNGEPRAFAEVTPVDGNVLEVRSIAYLDREALKGMIGFLRMYDGQYKRLKFVYLPENSPVEYILDADRTCEFGQFEGAMGRIMNIEKLLGLIQPRAAGAELSLKVYGDVINENNKIYDISSGSGSLAVSTRNDGEYDAEISVRTLSRLMFGSVAPCGIDYLDELEIKNNRDAFQVIFPKKSITLFERF